MTATATDDGMYGPSGAPHVIGTSTESLGKIFVPMVPNAQQANAYLPAAEVFDADRVMIEGTTAVQQDQSWNE